MSINPSSSILSLRSENETDWTKCIICQDNHKKRGKLVENARSESYQKLLNAVKQRADAHDGEYLNTYKRFSDCTKENLPERKAVWHRGCYAETTNEAHIQRARDRMHCHISSGSYSVKNRGQKRTWTETNFSLIKSSDSSIPFTRSATMPLTKDHCFFCQLDDGQQLFAVRTENAGKALKTAVEFTQNPELMTRLNNAISPSDAHAIGVQYHKSCWRRNVFHVLRDREMKPMGSIKKDLPLQASCLIELINLVDIQTQNQAYLPIDDIEAMYISMLGGKEEAEKHSPTLTRKWLKEKILSELPHVRSVRQKDQRKPSVLYSPKACEEEMVHTSMLNNTCEMDNTKLMYKTAKVIRNCIDMFFDEKSQTDSSIRVSSSRNDVASELYTLIRWILVAPEEELQTEMRSRTIDQSALTLSQNIMYAYRTKRQVKHKPKESDIKFRTQRAKENPQAVGLALTLHHDTRNKKLIDLLHAQNLCISYKRSLILETSIAQAVIENTRQFGGLYVPPFLKKQKFLFFAIDNTDFTEDTVDGRGTTHGTITAVYQKCDTTAENLVPELMTVKTSSLSLEPYHVPILSCTKPKAVSLKREQVFEVSTIGIAESHIISNLSWLIASSLAKKASSETTNMIPGWAGYNSLLSSSKTLTNVGALPLLPEVAHEWSTMFTVITQAVQLKQLVVGDDHPAVITFDMALYEKAIQLLDTKPDLKKAVIPRLGELHTVMAALRALGASIENSGIDDAWIESDVYSSSTVRQILQCSHYKRSLRAHIHSYTALSEIALEQFFKENPHMETIFCEATNKVLQALSKKSPRSHVVQLAHEHLCQVLMENDFLQKFEAWEMAKSSKSAMFKSTMNYLHRVEAILFFVAASRNCDLSLHLEAGEALSKLFFAFDRIKYKRLWPRYIADMQEMRTRNPQTWQELQEGSISVTKNEIPFVSIGADHACEHVNKMMKVHSGLIGISNNANARQRFFLASPEMARISSEFKEQFDLKINKEQEHHDLHPSCVHKGREAVDKIKNAILSHGNPFDIAGDQLFNFITHAFIPQEFVTKILNADNRGKELYEAYVAERINGDISLWAPVKKENNMMFKSGCRKQSVNIRDQTVDLKETKDLYGRLLVLTKSNRDIDQKHAIGNFEFTLTPRALFAPDGSNLPCMDKSKLIHCLEKLVESPLNSELEAGQLKSVEEETPTVNKKIAIIDGMVIVQKMTKKPVTVGTVKDLGEYCNEKIMALTGGFDVIIVVFDTYKVDSLKQRTRKKRQQGRDPVHYQITDGMKIGHLPMKRLLSHDKTKSELTEYLADAILKHNIHSHKLVITSAAGHTKSNDQHMYFENNNHEEADTLMICLAENVLQQDTNAELVFFSPDTDVLVLAVAHYERLCKRTTVMMASGEVDVGKIWRVLGREKSKALPFFHAFTGNDNIGRFCGIGKTKWLEQYIKAGRDIIEGLMRLPEDGDLTQEVKESLANFVCSVYCPRGVCITNIPDLRWHLFCKHMAESSNLPPTLGTLEEHIKRVRVQSRVWAQALDTQQTPFDPLEYGYYKDNDGHLLPVTTKVPPAPQGITELVRCQCKTSCSSQRCSCKRHELPCTDLCLCGDECENNGDYHGGYVSDSDDDL